MPKHTLEKVDCISNVIECSLTQSVIDELTTLPDGTKKPNSETIQSNLEAASELLRVLRLTYQNNGRSVTGYLVERNDLDEHTKHPCVIYNRGGTGDHGTLGLRHFYTHFFGLKAIVR